MVTLINEQLVDADKPETSVGDVLKYFGTLILRWRFCEGFLAAINQHRHEYVTPSDLIA